MSRNIFFHLQKTEKTEFLSYFYKHCMHILVAPLLAATADGKVGKCELFFHYFISLLIYVSMFYILRIKAGFFGI